MMMSLQRPVRRLLVLGEAMDGKCMPLNRVGLSLGP